MGCGIKQISDSVVALDRAAEEEKLARLSAMEAHIRRLERTMGPESPQVYSTLQDTSCTGLEAPVCTLLIMGMTHSRMCFCMIIFVFNSVDGDACAC
jgi:hypothetical protein